MISSLRNAVATFTILIMVMFALFFSADAFALTEQEAREELKRMKLPATEEEFVLQAEQGDVGIIELFLDAGLDPNSRDKDGYTPLMWIAVKGKSEIARMLLERGADPNVSNTKFGRTALMYAVSNGHDEVVGILLDADADVNIRDKVGWTALFFTITGGYLNIAALLVEHGAEVNVSEVHMKMSPLILAAAVGKEDIVKYLLQKGAAINARDKSGRTALTYARTGGHKKVIALLEHSGAME